MYKKLTTCLATLLFCSGAAIAHAGPITGVSITTNGAIRFDALGADGTGRGTAYYTIGNCSNNGVMTTCITNGTYTEVTGTNPGDVGSFSLTMTYAGTSVHSPSIVRSSPTNPNSIGFTNPTLNGALITLALSPGYGGLFVSTIPPFPPTGLGYSAFASGITCSGTPITILATQGSPLNPGCNIGNALMNSGAIATGSFAQNGFSFSIPADTVNAVPEPGTMLMLGTGLAMVAVRLRRGRKS